MSRQGSDAVVLVTGFPSLHARWMAREILTAESRAHVYALVPLAGSARAEAFRDALEPADRARLVFVEGAAASMDLGLSGAEFRQLTREVDRIHHVSQVSAGSIDRKAAFAANVAATSEIVEFARATSSLDRLVIHSTALVSGDRQGVVDEEDLAAGQAFRSDAEETRMLAETVARRAMRDVPIAVVRPTTLACDLDAGEDSLLDGRQLLVLVIVATPAETRS